MPKLILPIAFAVFVLAGCEDKDKSKGKTAETVEEVSAMEEPSAKAVEESSEPIAEDAATIKANDTAMVFVEGGTFTMGCTQGPDDRYEGEEGESWNVTCPDNEQPAHNVTLTKDFYIGKYEVTQRLWFDVMGTTVEQQRSLVYKRNPNYKNLELVGVGDSHPMYFVSWNEIQQFIGKLNELTGKNYRLPTEAEWDYAARGGNKSKGYKYYGSNNRSEVAWHEANNSSYGTKPVGTKKPNELGIYDMDGNVLEWVNDRFGGYTAEAKTDPQGPPSGEENRIIRGTGFNARADIFRPTFRLSDPPDYAFEGIGFRLASNAAEAETEAAEEEPE